MINNGFCKYCHISVAYGCPKKGVNTYRLTSERPRQNIGWGYPGLNYYNHTEIERLDHWSDATANIEMWAENTLMENIAIRGREFEKNMSEDYIDALNQVYNEYFFRYQDTPLIIINTYNGLFKKM